jgi:COP9 signalosome complex subunit 1
MTHEDLGNHFVRVGNLNGAAKSYARVREYCQTAKHLADLNFKLLYLSILQEAWNTVLTYRLKLFSGQKDNKDDKTAQETDAIVQACTGLSHLNLNQYRDAALAFTAVDPSYSTNAVATEIDFARAVITPNEIATYGAICALATMEPAELRTNVLENQKFRHFLELESHLRRAINMYCSNKFTPCLAVLDSYAADYKNDLYLGRVFKTLYRKIRAKCLRHWFSAFSVATLDELEISFPPTDDETLQAELRRMIMAGELNARIDVVDQVSFIHNFPVFSPLTIF